MLLRGDEFGRTQHGNNNAYCQDNEISWLDWDLTPSSASSSTGRSASPSSAATIQSFDGGATSRVVRSAAPVLKISRGCSQTALK